MATTKTKLTRHLTPPAVIQNNFAGSSAKLKAHLRVYEENQLLKRRKRTVEKSAKWQKGNVTEILVWKKLFHEIVLEAAASLGRQEFRFDMESMALLQVCAYFHFLQLSVQNVFGQFVR